MVSERPSYQPERRGYLFSALSLILVLLSPSHAGSFGERQNPNPPLILTSCKLPDIDETLRCGKLSVFENRQTRSGRKIDLNIVVLPALESTSKQEPLFDLAGGPGVASTSAAVLYAGDLKEYRRHRDVVLVDQRGTGKSNALDCKRGSNPQVFLDEMYPTKYVLDCRKELQKRADLAQYSTPIAMDDLDDVRAALGYYKISLFGLSYGTRAALVYIRQHGEHVSKAVLMGVTPTNNVLPMWISRDAQRAMNLLLSDCAEDQSCHTAFPNLRSELIGVLESLARKPARVRYLLPENGTAVWVTIHRDIFAEKLRTQLYEADKARALPYIIHEAARANFTPFLEIAIPVDRKKPDFISDGMYLSVTCSEGTPSINAAAAARINAHSWFGNYRIAQQKRACSLWSDRELPKSYEEPVTSAVPVLLLSGNMDPITPPEWGKEVAAHLPNSKHVIVPYQGHMPAGLSFEKCLDTVILDFLARGRVDELDSSCLTATRPFPFKLSGSAPKDTLKTQQ
jgi:pimeloyl-ACP methyl ester carboxylesterase